MRTRLQTAIHNYLEVYSKLYQRTPTDLQILDRNWVIVNGMRLQVDDLEHVTRFMQMEYDQSRSQKRSVVLRLLAWLKG